MNDKLLRLKELLNSLQRDEISTDEMSELESLRRSKPEYDSVVQELTNPTYVQQQMQARYRHTADTDTALVKVMTSKAKGKTAKVVVFPWLKLTAAASIIALALTGVFLYSQLDEKDAISEEKKEKQLTTDIPPGGSFAVLSLPDGQEVQLDQADMGVLTQQGGTDVVKQKDGQVIIRSGRNTGTPSPLSLSTPPGG
jgi:transmembrane sensor